MYQDTSAWSHLECPQPRVDLVVDTCVEASATPADEMEYRRHVIAQRRNRLDVFQRLIEAHPILARVPWQKVGADVVINLDRHRPSKNEVSDGVVRAGPYSAVVCVDFSVGREIAEESKSERDRQHVAAAQPCVNAGRAETDARSSTILVPAEGEREL